jgi:hypothetical protein
VEVMGGQEGGEKKLRGSDSGEEKPSGGEEDVRMRPSRVWSAFVAMNSVPLASSFALLFGRGSGKKIASHFRVIACPARCSASPLMQPAFRSPTSTCTSIL